MFACRSCARVFDVFPEEANASKNPTIHKENDDARHGFRPR
jgi:hypothetical protein